MWTKPGQLTSVAVARPLRVACVIDLDDAPDALFDAINLEAYGRRGGRRTLIVPAKAEGIDPRYLDWLSFFDADIITASSGSTMRRSRTCTRGSGRPF
jgi:hypothetical protein